MFKRFRSVWAPVFTGVTLALAATNVAAQSYPSKPIKIVVPFTPGGFNDTLGRTIAAHLTTAWNQPVVVENKPGGNTTIGTDMVAKAAPDGYTLLIIGFPFPVTPLLMKEVPYDVLKDFTPVIVAAATPNLLVVNPTVLAKSVKELIALAKAQPGAINYASTGSGTSNHISMELFKLMTGTNITHVPYKGSGPAVADLLGGQVQVMFDNVPNVLQHVKAGKLRALGVSGLKRSPLAPEVPTVDESGVPGYEVSVWFGLAAPAGTPRDIVDRLNVEVTKMLALPDVKQRFLAQGVETVGTTPAEATEYVARQKAKWAKVVAESGAKID
jgi:tripartite-type tricarboxylate transporter receptor subunit TctC